ncbi:MAG TPA: transglycosylase domain-containing protein [Candidatus Dojkabacteria bacterium]|nr:transglycosylase domain-containing protein [Candidatus Dojkabacteria bacterium]
MTQKKSIKIKNLSKKEKVRSKRTPKNFKTNRKITKRDTISRLLVLLFVIISSVTIFSFIASLKYLQNVSKDLPSPDKPFGRKQTATEIYDRNGELLYRVFDNEDRDPVDLETIPPQIIWTYLAAEDLRFFEHQGVDLEALARCSFRYLEERTIVCGGSTITQQLIRKTALTDEVAIARKIKEMLLALKIEQVRSKEEILEMYLTVVPSGSNIYGVTRASKFYFGKAPEELSLAEMAVLASIPQNPSILSPTKSTNPEISKELLESRKNYVLNQIESNLDFINNNLLEIYGPDTELFTKEMIEIARKEEIAYQDPSFRINAPHFVFYALEQLQKNGYNDGKPLTLEQIETEGLRIHTTLDMDYQRIAESQVKKAVSTYGKQFGADNAAMVVLNPKNGDVLAMVGSYDYFGKASPEGCQIGLNCRYEPQVNVPDTLQAYGSTLKPMIYYNAFMRGIMTPETLVYDAPITIGKYTPKNYDGQFSGLHPYRYMLVQSRNIPAIILLEKIGYTSLIEQMKTWGYTTMNNPNGYGLSLAVGGGELKLIEHAQGYAVFANNGKFTQHEVISKIVDRNGEILYEHQPITTQVADPRGVYLVNDILNGNKGGPGFSFDGRDMAGKTGTSEDQTETLYIGYSPEIVVAGMLINNDNTPMRYGATGQTSVRPWVGEYLQLASSKYPPTPFEYPNGIEIRTDGNLYITGISPETTKPDFNYQFYTHKNFQPYPTF